MNEATSYNDFVERALALDPHLDGPDAEDRDHILSVAWEDCAWIATLTDERIMRALDFAQSETF